MYGRLILTLLLWTAYSCGISANSLDHRFQKAFQVQRLSLEQGLSQSVVNSIIQDSQGYFWIGTEDGLNRFDGYEFTIFEHQHSNPKSLHDNFIYSIAEQPGLGIWVGTQNGLSLYNPVDESFTNYQYLHEDLRTAIAAIAVLPSGNIAIGSDNGLFVYNSKVGSTELFESEHKQRIEDEVTSITVVNDTVWVSTESCVYALKEKDNSLVNYCEGKLKKWLTVKGNSVKDIEVKHQSIWLGTNSGLIRYDLITDEVERFFAEENNPNSLTSDFIQTMTFDQEGNLWIGTSQGLNVYRYSKSRFEHYLHKTHDSDGLSSNELMTIFIDKNGLVWLGTYATGVNILNPIETDFKHVITKSDLAKFGISNTVHGIEKDNNEYLWLATYGGGIVQLDLMTGDISRPLHDEVDVLDEKSSYTYSLHIDYKNRMWIGTIYGIYLFDLDQKKILPVHFYSNGNKIDLKEFIFKIYEDHSNRIWIGTNSHLFRVEKEIVNNGQLTFYLKDFQPEIPYSYKDRSSRISSILETRDGNIWVGGVSGLLMYSQEHESWFHYEYHNNNSQSLSNDDVQVLFEDSRGILWVGTANGLNKVIRETEDEIYFERITKVQGLPNNNIYGILEDAQKQLWLSTNLGLVRYSAYSDSMQSFRRNDGLSSDEFNTGAYFADSDGLLYFGSINGVTVVDSKVKIKKYIERELIFTEVKVGQRNFDLYQLNNQRKPIISKQQDESTIKISVADLYFQNLGTQSYRYRVLGLNDDWVYLGKERSFVLAGLQEGKYYIDIQSKVGQAAWSENKLRLQLNVETDFFKSSLSFYLLLILSFLLFGIVLYLVSRHYKSKLAKLENLVKVEEIRLKDVRKQNASLKLELESKVNEIDVMTEEISDSSYQLKSHQFRDSVSGFYRYQNITRMLADDKKSEENISFNHIFIFHLTDLLNIEQEYGKICSAEIISYVAIKLRQKCPSNVHICALNEDTFVIFGNADEMKNLSDNLSHLRTKILHSKIPIANDKRVQIHIVLTYLEITNDKIKKLSELIKLSDLLIVIHQKISLLSASGLLRVELHQSPAEFQSVNPEKDLDDLLSKQLITTHFLN
ncbi:ligand-binding sensor domain-containing protein [Aliikangiella sp. IMCC44359]|uniref:ligand-binding sensor domain-containing protein n=1 Tax=Aliikangiella sp. IMCC44359 TaxID=3459125 RepID=UPI00403AA177